MSDRYEIRWSKSIKTSTSPNEHLDDKFSDLTIISRGKEYLVHKIILCSAIPYFDKMCSSGMKESVAKNIELDHPTEILDIIIDWAYDRPTCITNENVLELMELACFMCITELVEKCEAFCASRSYSSHRLTPCSSIKYLDHKFSDLTIKNKGKRYYVHKIILCSAIPYFNKMFSPGTKESTVKSIKLDFTSKIFDLIIDWAYHKRIFLTHENVSELQKLADYMYITDLLEKCKGFCFARSHFHSAYKLNTCSSIKYLDDKFSDLTIISRGKEHFVHKIILCSAIPYFDEMCSSGMKKSITKKIELDHPTEILDIIIDWAYGRTLCITNENVLELQKLSDYMGIEDLVKKCGTYERIFHGTTSSERVKIEIQDELKMKTV